MIKSDYSFGSERITKEKYTELSSAAVEPGDVLITRAGTVGESDVFPPDAEAGIWDSNLIRVKVDNDICLPEFLSLFLSNSEVARFQIVSMTHGGTRANLNNGIIKSIVVPIPPTDEQEKIVDIFTTIDDLKGIVEKTISKREEVRSTLIQRYLTGEYRVV